MPAIESNESGQSRKKREISGRSVEDNIPSTLNTYTKRMQVFAFISVTVILTGLLIGVFALYRSEKVQSSDTILMFILAQVLGVWVGLTNKIFRIMPAPDKQSN